MLIKEHLNNMEHFPASKGWLEMWKLHELRETFITREADDMPRMTIKSWIECLPELTDWYDLKDSWSMDELGQLLKVLSDSGIATKNKNEQRGKNQNNV